MFILKNNPSLRRMSQIRRNFGATCTLKGTRARKSLVGDHYTQAQGRSMVEMLGVLAIIGVLSVGAIAGYSKAMMKYKLNKQSEQLNTVINTIARNIHSFDNLHASSGNTPDLTRYFIKMGEIPTEMVQNTGFLKDVFGIQWASFINSTDTHIFLEGIAPVLKTKSADNLAI